MQRQGSLAMTSPCCKSSRQITHSPLSSVNMSSDSNMNAQSVLKTTVLLYDTSSQIYNNTTTILRPFVQDYPGEPVPEETLTHPPSWSSSNLYLLPSNTIHSIILVQIMCLAIFLHNLFPCPLWSTSWSGALHLIFHTFLHPISVFFSQHIPIPLQPVLL